MAHRYFYFRLSTPIFAGGCRLWYTMNNIHFNSSTGMPTEMALHKGTDICYGNKPYMVLVDEAFWTKTTQWPKLMIIKCPFCAMNYVTLMFLWQYWISSNHRKKRRHKKLSSSAAAAAVAAASAPSSLSTSWSSWSVLEVVAGVYTKFSGRLSEEPFPWLIQEFPCILIFKIGQPGCQHNLSEGQIRLDLTSGRPLV